MSNPLISVIIPAYNIEPYIARCLDSVLAQSYTNLEIIIVNDGSKDNTGNILEEYKKKDDRIRVIHKENTGVSDTRNKGIDAATGEYIGFVDGDDVIHQDMYKTLLENAIKYDADISHCGYQMVFPNRTDDYYGTEKLVLQDNHKGVFDLLDASYVEPGLCIKLYRRDLIGKYRLDKSIRINEDLLFNYDMFKKAKKSVYEDKMLYYYMVRSASASTQKTNRYKILNPVDVMRHIMNNEEGELQAIAQRRLFYLLEKICVQDKSQLREHISEEEYTRLKLEAKRVLKAAKNNCFISVKQRCQAILAIYFPMLYRMIYKVYDIKAKSSKKFEV